MGSVHRLFWFSSLAFLFFGRLLISGQFLFVHWNLYLITLDLFEPETPFLSMLNLISYDRNIADEFDFYMAKIRTQILN